MANEESKKISKEKKNSEVSDKSGNEQNNSDSETKNRNRRQSYRRRRRSYIPYAVLLKEHEEAMKTKKVLDTKITGTVKWFSMRYHYGFIARDDGKGDVFIHQMNIVKSRMHKVYMRSLATDEKVEFDVVEGKNGPEAANVTGPDGINVRGIYVIRIRQYVNNRRPNYRRNASQRNQRRRTESKVSADESSGEKKNAPRANRRRSNKRNKHDNRKAVEHADKTIEEVGSVKVAN